MTKRLLAIPVVSILMILIALGFLAPELRRNNPSVDPNITASILDQARTNFDAPALELISKPFYRVVKFTATTAKVAVYSRLGFRIATMTIQECKYTGGYFSCGGIISIMGLVGNVILLVPHEKTGVPPAPGIVIRDSADKGSRPGC